MRTRAAYEFFAPSSSVQLQDTNAEMWMATREDEILDDMIDAVTQMSSKLC